MSSMQGMRERADRGQPRGAGSIWQAATHEHGVRSRRRRRVRFTAAAVAAALAVTIGTTAIVDFDDSQPVVATSPGTVDDPADQPSGRTAAVPDAGISVLVPDGWVFTTNDLSPDAGLQERFAVSTFEPSVGGARCAHLPIAAIEQMSRTDAFVWMDERGPTGGNNDGFQKHVPGQRADFEGIDSNSTIPECLHDDALDNLATLRWLPLHSAGRGFYLIVAIGADADTNLRTQVTDVVASIELTPYVPILLERYLDAVADEIRCLESAGATVIGPFPSIDGANLIYDYTPTTALTGGRLDQGQAALDSAGAECFERHTSESAREWNSSLPDGGDPALMAARGVVLDCLRLPADATDAAVIERLTADPPEGITDSCTALTWTELGIEGFEPGSPDPAADWSDSTWAVLPDDEDFVMRFATVVPGAGESRGVGYTSPDGDTFNVFISSASTEPAPVAGPLANAVQVGDVDGVLETDPSQRSASVNWTRDGFAFNADTDTLGPDELVRLAGLLRPATETELPLPVVSFGLDALDQIEVATEDLDGETLTLRASTSDGSAFFLWIGGGGGGPTFLAPDALVYATAASGTGHPPVVYGLVDQSVASLRLRMIDGTERPVEIQGRSARYPVAFFLIAGVTFDALASLDAFDATGAAVDSFDLSALFGRALDNGANPTGPTTTDPD